MAKSKKSRWLRIIIIIISVIILLGIFAVYYISSGIELKGKKSEYLYIRTGADFKEVLDSLSLKKYNVNIRTFKILAGLKNYKEHIKPGKYLISDGMNNNKLVNMLKSGKQEAVKLVFNNVRTKYQVAGKIAKQLEADSASIIHLLNDSLFLKKYGFNTNNAIVVFIPNTYEIYWNTSAKQLFERMNNEYKDFWNDERKEKAQKAGLTPIQAEILASIVQEETAQYSEMSTIAGLYINRLNKGMKLEADPTVKFAIGDFNIKRILKRHLDFESPYNTYKHTGLPPGPISLSDSRVIDKVLNYEKNNYIYMCAKEDFSGYHNFAKTGAEHAANARKYQLALNKLKIYE